MKKIFFLAFVLTTFVSTNANAQGKMMQINLDDGTYEDFYLNEVDSITFKDDKWVSLGMCDYTEDFLANITYGTGYLFNRTVGIVTYEVEIQENIEQPGLYRLVNPYGEAYPYTAPGEYDDTKDYYIEINACDPDGVYIRKQDIGVKWEQGEMWMVSAAGEDLPQNYTLEEEKSKGNCGTLKDGVITFPTDAIWLNLPEISFQSSRVFYYRNLNGRFRIVLP